MELHKLSFNKKDLSQLDENEKVLIFHAGTIFNEINILYKVARMSYSHKLTDWPIDLAHPISFPISSSRVIVVVEAQAYNRR